VTQQRLFASSRADCVDVDLPPLSLPLHPEYKHHETSRFTWHHVAGADRFDRGAIWKMSKAYIKKKLPGYVRLQCICVLNGMDGGAKEDEASGAVKRPHKDDMLRQVIFAFFIFHSKIPLHRRLARMFMYTYYFMQ
jgi:hypothetical protein